MTHHHRAYLDRYRAKAGYAGDGFPVLVARDLDPWKNPSSPYLIIIPNNNYNHHTFTGTALHD